MPSKHGSRTGCAAVLVACCAALLAPWLTLSSAASAQIRQARNHPHYDVELEPHLVFQWAEEPFWDDDGIGVGLRASIPVIQDGPIRSINNSLAIGFGLDWAHFDDCGPFNDVCDADDFWLPIVVQWNFFLTREISVFPEIGLGIEHSRLEWDGAIPGDCRRISGIDVCDDDATDTDVEFVFWLGGRFGVSDDIALTIRLGTPSILLGVSFLL